MRTGNEHGIAINFREELTVTDPGLLEKLILLRKKLHTIPEPSWKEYRTAETIQKFIAEHTAGSDIQKLPGTGFLVTYKGLRDGAVTVIRCELDGVPVTESPHNPVRSENAGMSHACGHDGHMAVSAGLAVISGKHRPEKGTVALLFQPAEETGEGAAAVMAHPAFRALNPDYIFGFHNIPGAPAGTVIVRDNIFAFASRGMHITLTGSPAHAADPDAGKNPTAAALEIAAALPLSATLPCRATVTYVRIGSPYMGRAPFDADIAVTLRAPQGSDLDRYGESVTTMVSDTAAAAGLKVSISWSDIFPETINSQRCTEIVRQTAVLSELSIETTFEPFLWSEDFGYYTQKYRGALLGIGAGNIPPLHNEDYTFPDAIIAPALKLYLGIIRLIHNG